MSTANRERLWSRGSAGAVSPALGREEVRVSASPAFIARVGGVPYEAVASLKIESAARLVNGVLDREERLMAERQSLSETLGALVPALTDDSVRQAVIRTRRSLYNFKSPRPADLLAMAPLPADVSASVGRVASEVAEYRAALDRLPGTIQAGLAQSRERLRERVSSEEFMGGLVVASPVLFGDVCRQLDHGPNGQAMRSVEGALIRYLVRSATKTSPFGRFTAIARGEWAGGDFMRLGDPRTAVTKESHIHLSVGWLTTLERFLMSRREVRQEAPVRLNPARWRADGRLWWVKRKPSARSLNVVHNSESVASLEPSPLIEHFLSDLDALHGEPVTYSNLGGVVARAAEGKLSAEEVTQTIEKLIEVGLVQLGIPIPANVPDPWGYFDRHLPATGSSEAVAKAKGVLDGMRRVGSEFRTATSRRRARLLDHVGELRREYMKIVESPLANEKETAVRQFLFEDTGVREPLSCDPRKWQELVSDLRSAVNVFLLYDSTLVNQFDMAEEYRRSHGEGRVLGFWQFFNIFHLPRIRRQTARGDAGIVMGGAGLTPHPNEYASPGVAVVNELRAELREVLAQHNRGGGDVLHLGADLLRSWGRRFPNPYPAALRSSLFCMFGKTALKRDGDDPAGVINACSMGYGKFMSRFCWMMDAIQETTEGASGPSLSQAIRADNAASAPPDTVLAEFGGYFGAFDVESHPPLTPFEIEYPGEVSGRPASEMIRLGDLEVGYNRDTRLLELRSRSLGRKVWPLHLGFLSPSHTPPLFRCLKELSVPLSAPAGRPSLWREEQRAGIKILHAPRIQVGRVLVAREEWAVPAEAMPFSSETLPFWLELQRLRRRIGMPSTVFRSSDLFARYLAENEQGIAQRAGALEARATKTDESGGTAPSPYPVAAPVVDDGRPPPVKPVVAYRDDARKPMFLDFDSYLLVAAFHKTGNLQGSRVFFSEAMPAPRDLLLQNESGSFASELVIELAGTSV